MTGELSGGGYARQSISFGAPSGASISNDAQVLFPTATADWTGVTHCAIMDASTGGNCLARDTVTGTISNGDTVSFEIGDIDILLLGNAGNDYGAILAWMFDGGTMPSRTFYASLHDALPIVSNEVDFTGYARQEITSWKETSGTVEPNHQVVWGPMAGDSTSRTYYTAFYDAASGGNILIYGNALTGVTIDDPDGFAAGTDALTWRFE